MQFDASGNRARVDALRSRGVDVWGPERVYIGEDVDLQAIEPGAVIRYATLSGRGLSVASGAVIGTSGHAEVHDCQIGRDVELGSGLYHGATFLQGVKVRGFAEIRPETLLEEQAEAAHNVALKNTTFTSCCVAGSLINFCDLFLSGGRSRRDHTEIGSGAIHFNFDPRGDKWGSLIGGIRGVLMQSDPVFIGGNCGLVGPLEVGFGSVTAAGSVIRKNVGENMLVASHSHSLITKRIRPSEYGSLRSRFGVTAKLIGTLRALDAWYGLVRAPRAHDGEGRLYEAARGRINAQIAERIRRLERIIEKLSQQTGQGTRGRTPSGEHRVLVDGWGSLRRALETSVDPREPPREFLEPYIRARDTGKSHLDAIKSAVAGAPQAARWLDGLVEQVTARANQVISPVRTRSF